MSGSLKSRNGLGLYAFMAANFAVFCGAIQHDAILSLDWSALLHQPGGIIPASLGVALTGLLNAQLTPMAKARIVFLRWRSPLPGSEAFSKYGPADSRIDMNSFRAFADPLPTAPDKQNAVWYRMYKTVEAKPAVMQAHGSFLFARDFSSLALLLLIVLGPLALFAMKSKPTMWIYLSILVAQFLVARRAARTNGIRFVTNVLAEVGATQPLRDGVE